jgi:Malectin domain
LSSATQAVPDLRPTVLIEDERQELEAVAAALQNASRQLRLITYIGEKYFRGELEKLHEYDIATEVFGRSKDTFNGGEDAIVRVEAHRLRKRLKEYYSTEGKDHPIHVSIPPGTYVPVFTRQSSVPAERESEVAPTQPDERPWSYIYIVAIAAVGLVFLCGYLLFRPHTAKKDTVGSAASTAKLTVPSIGAPYAVVPLRILAGYSGQSQIDAAGNVWQPDQHFHGGGTWDRPDNIAMRTSAPILFKHSRNGDFTYDIPLRPGAYELHLYFVAAEQDSSNLSTFTVYVNGNNVLSNFDVRSDALGANIADERVFRDVGPDGNGFLHLAFSSERAPATLNAIEILPGTPHQQLPIRLLTQPISFTDHSGHFWHPDDDFLDGYTSRKGAQITGTSDPDLFTEERYGHFTYAIPVDPRDRYTLILHFAEFYFGPSASGIGGDGSRVFRVLCNGNTLLDNFDIYKEAGSLHALTKTFYHLKPTAQGKLNIAFEPIANNATVSGIEVLDESQ